MNDLPVDEINQKFRGATANIKIVEKQTSVFQSFNFTPYDKYWFLPAKLLQLFPLNVAPDNDQSIHLAVMQRFNPFELKVFTPETFHQNE